MDIRERGRIVYMSCIYMCAIYTGLAIRSMVLGENDRLIVFYIPALMAGALIIISIIKNVMHFIDRCVFAVLFSGCFYTAVKCSGTLLYMAAMLLTMLLLFWFIRNKLKYAAYIGTPAEVFEIKMFILKSLHFIFIFSVLFTGMESVTIFSITYALASVTYIFLMRNYILQEIKGKILAGTFLELAVVMCMVIIMPHYPSGNIVELQAESTMGGYMAGFLCALILSLLEIPFNPVWTFEKNLKG